MIFLKKVIGDLRKASKPAGKRQEIEKEPVGNWRTGIVKGQLGSSGHKNSPNYCKRRVFS